MYGKSSILRSNLTELAVYSHTGDLSFLPPSVPASLAPKPSPPHSGLKFMGSYLSGNATWAGAQLVKAVPKALRTVSSAH